MQNSHFCSSSVRHGTARNTCSTRTCSALSKFLDYSQPTRNLKSVCRASLPTQIYQTNTGIPDPTNTVALEKHYAILVRVARIIGAAIVSRGSHNVVQGRRFLTDHRMLVMHVLKRSAGIGAGHMGRALEDRVEELADAFMVLITATEFLEVSQKPLSVLCLVGKATDTLTSV